MTHSPARAWFSVLAVVFLLPAVAAADPSAQMARYNVVWNSPSKDATGAMPIGNGDVAAGVYAIENGDLYLLLAKNDAFNQNGDIYKTGRVRLSLTPNPFATGKAFKQTLDLPTASVRIDADGVNVRIWADANRPVFHVEVDSPRELAFSARPEFWKRLDDTKDVCIERNGRILWYFAVGDRSVFAEDLKFYLVEHMIDKFPDPYRFNTFGNLMTGKGLALKDGTLTGKGKRLDLVIHAACTQTPKAEEWIAAIERQAAAGADAARDWPAHRAWWDKFWQRSWIVATDNTLPAEAREKLVGEAPSGVREDEDGAALTAQNYNVFRFLMACQSRGRIQTKFNGGLFTQQLRVGSNRGRQGAGKQPDGSWLTHEDDRLWGRRFTYQNQRLLYWPLLMSGDFDLTRPFFDFYVNVLPVRREITKAWFGHEGAYYRENIEPTGGERDCGSTQKPPKTKPGEPYKGWYHDYYFTAGLETLAMMIDYVRYTADATFRDQALVPFAREVLLFFDKHYPRDEKGKIRLEPAQVLETWWVAVNPAPDVAGLQFCLDELLAMKGMPEADQKRWRRMRGELPEIHLHEIDGRKAIAPALTWDRKRNAENGELYPVFPFRCFGLGLGTGDIVEWTMQHRSCKDAFACRCWTQDQIHWAYAGRGVEARDGLVRRYRWATPICRFPMYGREGPDSCPDFDHFGAGSTALQRMLVQEAGSKVLLLPAWPADWDVDFRLHLAGPAVISATVKDGRLVAWDIQPPERKKDVIVHQPQAVPVRPTIPANNLPLRAGCDSNGANRFRGQIARVSLIRGKLDQAAVARLAALDRTKPVKDENVAGSWLGPKVGDALPTKPDDLAGPVTFEAWINPGADEKGRILDKLTAGNRDGFLLDTWPGLSLRLIVGPREDVFKGVLKGGTWQHVAFVVDRGYARVYLDGKRLK